MNDNNASRRGATMIDPETLNARQMRLRSPEKLRPRHPAARANPRPALSALPGVLERSKVASEAGVRGISVQKVGLPYGSGLA
jgi:hypothetical protein